MDNDARVYRVRFHFNSAFSSSSIDSKKKKKVKVKKEVPIHTGKLLFETHLLKKFHFSVYFCVGVLSLNSSLKLTFLKESLANGWLFGFPNQLLYITMQYACNKGHINQNSIYITQTLEWHLPTQQIMTISADSYYKGSVSI